MTEGEFPFRSFTMRSEGYDRTEVDSYVDELQSEITEQRRAIEAATHGGEGASDTRLHDPEGAVTRTLAIAQETADRVLHDAQVEADRRRAEADEHASAVIADADERAARLLGDMESQAAEVREQGVAAARSAIQVERDKAMAELAHVRRVRDDLRNEAVDLKAALDSYRSQAREASDTLAAAASGPLMSLDLPDFIDDDVVLAGISASADTVLQTDVDEIGEIDEIEDTSDEVSYLRAVDEPDDDDGMANVLAFDGDTVADEQVVPDDADYGDATNWDTDDQVVADDSADTSDDEPDDDDDDDDAEDDGDFGGTFLAEVRAAADDDVTLAPENDDSDRFLSELRGIGDDQDGDSLDSDAADRFFNDEA